MRTGGIDQERISRCQGGMVSKPTGNAEFRRCKRCGTPANSRFASLTVGRFSRLLVITSPPISRCTLRRHTHHIILSLDGCCILNSLSSPLTLAASHPATNHVRRLEADHQPWSPVQADLPNIHPWSLAIIKTCFNPATNLRIPAHPPLRHPTRRASRQG
jgi:hypothetical protein